MAKRTEVVRAGNPAVKVDPNTQGGVGDLWQVDGSVTDGNRDKRLRKQGKNLQGHESSKLPRGATGCLRNTGDLAGEIYLAWLMR